MPGRGLPSSTGYRYGFNGKEDDQETVGTGNGTQDYGMRIYNPSLGKFLSVDPLTASYPFYTPYQFAGNMPIRYIDLDGAEPAEPGKEKGQIGEATIQGSNNFINYAWSWNGGAWENKGGAGVSTEVVPRTDLERAVTGGQTTLSFDRNNYSIRTRNFPLHVNFGMDYRTPSVYWEFEHGAGPENSVFLDNHFATVELRDYNNEVDRMRFLVYAKFGGDKNAMIEYANANGGVLYTGFSGYEGGFRPKDERGGPSQFIGSFSGDVLLSNDGKSLVFVITDSKSIYSLALHASESLNRVRDPNKRTPFGNTYQKYIWSERIANFKYNSEKRYRDENGNVIPQNFLDKFGNW